MKFVLILDEHSRNEILDYVSPWYKNREIFVLNKVLRMVHQKLHYFGHTTNVLSELIVKIETGYRAIINICLRKAIKDLQT